MARKDIVAGQMWQPRDGNQNVMTLNANALALEGGQLLVEGVAIGSTLDEVTQFVIDGGGSAITTGVKGWLHVPYQVEVIDWVIGASPSGSIQIDIWVDSHTNFPPIDADSITGANPIVISGGTKNRMSTLAGWTTTIPADSWFVFNVDSCTDITKATVALKTRRTV